MLQDAGSLSLATTRERRALRALCEANHLDHCLFFFRHVFGEEFYTGPHHVVIADTLERVERGEITRLIINIPPGYTKTMEAVIMWISRMLGRYPSARFIHTSFSDTLVADNSTQIRDVILSPEYQAMWPTQIRTDVGKKGLWRTTKGGGMLAAPAKGSITGFRAGRMQPGFTGALVMDDPLKPDDARKKAERTSVNTRYLNTMRSRLAHEGVPVILIMQRLHMDDLSGFLLKGGSGEYWHHLMLPVTIDNAQPYPAEFTHGIPIDHGLPDGPLWERKLNAAQIKVMAAAEYEFASQYGQNPMAMGGAVWKREWFRYWKPGELPNLVYRKVFVDTAQKDQEQHDYSVFQCWGKGVDGKAYLLDQARGRWQAPDLKKNAEAFWVKHKQATKLGMGALRAMAIEDKVSGTTLLQSLEGIPVEAIPRNTQDKYMRSQDVITAWSTGLVMFPFGEPWLAEYETEMLGFPNAAFDDQVDPTMDAVAEMIGTTKDLLELL